MNRFVPIAISALTSITAQACDGDIVAGKAKALTCAAYHGQKGISNNPVWPNLARQKANYLSKQMRNFRDGIRKDALMGSMEKHLSDDDIDDISAFYSSLKSKYNEVSIMNPTIKSAFPFLAHWLLLSRHSH